MGEEVAIVHIYGLGEEMREFRVSSSTDKGGDG
jgi:hypothetical protein